MDADNEPANIDMNVDDDVEEELDEDGEADVSPSKQAKKGGSAKRSKISAVTQLLGATESPNTLSITSKSIIQAMNIQSSKAHQSDEFTGWFQRHRV